MQSFVVIGGSTTEQKGVIRLPDKQATELFNEKTEQSAIAYFDSKRVSMNDISRLLFMESLKNTRIARSRHQDVCDTLHYNGVLLCWT
jgi:hypothetical protein